jgi:integrase
MMDEATQDDGSSYARATRRAWWRVAKVVLDDLAADFGLPCPTRRVRSPQASGGTHREKATLTLPQMQALVDTASVLEGQRYREVLTLATTGMRVGEMYGLKWPDIKYDRGVIAITRSATAGEVRQYTKTKGTRDVPLAPTLAHELREQHKELLADEHPGLGTKLVFPSDVGTARYGGSIRKAMRRLTEAMREKKHLEDKADEFYLTPQVLRRSVNTLCVTRGVDKLVTRSILGHADEQMTELYAGVDMESKRRTMKGALGSLFEGD